VAKLSAPKQDLLASRLLAELAAESDFDRAIANSAGKLFETAACRVSGAAPARGLGRPSNREFT
jgi:hypothetical protein